MEIFSGFRNALFLGNGEKILQQAGFDHRGCSFTCTQAPKGNMSAIADGCLARYLNIFYIAFCDFAIKK